MLRVMPDSAVAFANLGRIAVAMHDIPTALMNFEEALRLDPTDYYFSILYITGWMQLGDYERASAEFNHRRSCFPIQKLPQPPWRGESVKNASIVLNAGVAGFGDAIQSVRLARVIQEEGARVIVKTRRELVRLFRTVPGVDQVQLNDETSPEASFECGADEVAFQRSLVRDTYASFVPYVFPSSSMTDVWKGRITPDKFNVGIVWRGADLAMNDPYRQRSMPLDKFRPLPDQWHPALQSAKSTRGRKTHSSRQIFPAIPLGSVCRDFLDLAGAISALDLVISVDTSVAHLSGALGKPTWVLIPYAPVDWRWQIGCEDDVWYPSVRLFRQQEPGDWDQVVGRVVRALTSLVPSLGRSQIPHRQAESTSLPEVS
jgi:tetratricopeptide (TPR) repeat protein